MAWATGRPAGGGAGSPDTVRAPCSFSPSLPRDANTYTLFFSESSEGGSDTSWPCHPKDSGMFPENG
ncbi:Hypothetical predicted protein, partial [Lynx pardinus]